MKTFPEAVQHGFPREFGDLPERPWWYLSATGTTDDALPCFRRKDAPRVVVDTVEEVAAYDAAHPLPHPGYRAGQVWAHEDGSSVVVSRTLLRANDAVLDIAGSGWKADQFASIYPYLMADPACPHLAPWSPCEVKP